jgi:hypothetical protein
MLRQSLRLSSGGLISFAVDTTRRKTSYDI